MDKLLYIAMSGAKETLRAQAVNNHNLANASTTGFRADLSAFQSRAVVGSGYASRVYATNATTGWDSTVGAQISIGAALLSAVLFVVSWPLAVFVRSFFEKLGSPNPIHALKSGFVVPFLVVSLGFPMLHFPAVTPVLRTAPTTRPPTASLAQSGRR